MVTVSLIMAFFCTTILEKGKMPTVAMVAPHTSVCFNKGKEVMGLQRRYRGFGEGALKKKDSHRLPKNKNKTGFWGGGSFWSPAKLAWAPGKDSLLEESFP